MGAAYEFGDSDLPVVVTAGLSPREVTGHLLDVRENVRFTGGELTRWIHERYVGTGCALAVEFKKTFMDEWTDAPTKPILASSGPHWPRTSLASLTSWASGRHDECGHTSIKRSRR